MIQPKVMGKSCSSYLWSSVKLICCLGNHQLDDLRMVGKIQAIIVMCSIFHALIESKI